MDRGVRESRSADLGYFDGAYEDHAVSSLRSAANSNHDHERVHRYERELDPEARTI